MDSNAIYKVILDQREELHFVVNEEFVHRNEIKQISLNDKLAQVVIGVRRSGKSTLCHMALRNAGITYGYINFDDDRLANLMVEDLNIVLESIYRVYGNDIKYVFFDEIQNVDGWHLFINRLLRQGLHIVITGSNARLLSSELATHLTGRYHEIRLYPFSFKDYCASKGIGTDIPTTKNVAVLKNTLDEYLIEGGFPELSTLSDRHGYVGSLIDAIITKDIMPRFHIRNANSLKTLANHLINNAGQIINMTDLAETLKIGSDKTIRNYIDYLAQAFLIVPLTKFSYKSSERLRNNKAYIVDTGMLTYRHNILSSENLGWRLENIVFLELQRRNIPLNRDIFYYRQNARLKEVDFVVAERGYVIELIQVSYDISHPKTLTRELDALIDTSQKTGCKNLTLIACSESRTEKVSDTEINIISAVEWLLSKS
ncbi:ATP-binding protein [Xylanibacter muris]|uniref:ATP-binding protein n=1 Tax=Xylanibacter muris TaxID=2736290 RepID=A0ABX2AIK6_9BACT|nr:ATP-binding protein [Xylanibacter muris]NPD90871.1 ATP-binding protein [Xylanibacter muris]